MTPEELLKLVPNPIEFWLIGRHSYDKGILVVTADQVLFVNDRGQTQHWNKTDITECSTTDLLDRCEISLTVTGSFLKERFEAQTIDAERFVAALAIDESRSDVAPLQTEMNIPITTSTESVDVQLSSAQPSEPWQHHLNALREMKLLSESEFTTIHQRALAGQSAPEPEIGTDEEPQDHSEIATFIRTQEQSLSKAHTWPLTLGCFSGLAVFAGSIALCVVYEISLCAGLSLSFVGLFVAFFLIGISIAPSNRLHYNRTIKPLIDSFLRHNDMALVDFVHHAATVLDEDSDLLKILRQEAGIEAPEASSD